MSIFKSITSLSSVSKSGSSSAINSYGISSGQGVNDISGGSGGILAGGKKSGGGFYYHHKSDETTIIGGGGSTTSGFGGFGAGGF